MRVLFSRALAVVAIIGGTAVASGEFPNRGPAGIVRTEPSGPISALTTDGVMRWNPADKHYWLMEVVPGEEAKLAFVKGYARAADCWQATFYEPEAGTAGQWRVCVPLDEPAEEFLAEHIVRAMGMNK